jgi:hypothetical protein
MRVKLITGEVANQPGVNAHPFEDEINAWLQANPLVTISHIKVSTTPCGDAANKYQALCLIFFEGREG